LIIIIIIIIILSILWHSQNGDHPEEDLVKFGYNQDEKEKEIKQMFMFLATYLNHI
jgi:hypothetical protein